MRKTFSSVFVVIFLLSLATPVSAVEEVRMQPFTSGPVNTASPSSTQPMPPRVMPKKTFRGEITDKRMEMKQTMSSDGATLRTSTSPLQNRPAQMVNNRFETVNESVLQTWATALDQLENMVERASSEAAGLLAADINTASVEASISRAEFAISTAKSTVRAQANKTYTMPDVENKLMRTTAQATLTQMRTDMRVTHMSVVSAKTAVRSVMSALVTAKTSLDPVPPVASNGAEITE
jgi:hypothetical protein